METADYQKTVEIECDRQELYRAVVKAVHGLNGMNIKKKDKRGGRILVKAATGFIYGYETVNISLSRTVQGRTALSLSAVPPPHACEEVKGPTFTDWALRPWTTSTLMAGTRVYSDAVPYDRGYSRKNVDRIIEKVSNILGG